MGVLRRLAQKLTWRPYRLRRAWAMPDGWPYHNGGLRPGINEVAASIQPPVREPSDSVTYALDLEIGEVANGYRLIVRSILLTGKSLLVDCVFLPEPTDVSEAEYWPEIRYDADVSPRGWNQYRADFNVFERPVPKARHAWFDFFQPGYDWHVEFYSHEQPSNDYLRNRIARLTLDLKTGETQIER
jgi:hypothetical protein